MKTNTYPVTLLWRITAIVAILLLIVTLLLASKARSQADSGFAGQIANSSSTVYLYRTPDIDAQIISILENGIIVHVDNSRVKNERTWYHIQIENASGWILEGNLVIP